ncbi:hypothetical protein OOK31_38465 [Streptomyces sp. NBC_00249]|uniref:hypothetical protein n=1 Tax=Streptomyces sp. NBC_00249 TaxID=2975690 RepID=UPI0022528277|nr:hypothetical protein [Streptomyces sp. NBC_00249]MCX5199696.1 hypothetical protein [Streptomyces sp. NBC_00249]
MTTPASNRTESDEQSFIETAQSLLASRLDVVRPLAQLIAERKHLQAQLDDVDKRYGAAYATAEAGGWTAGELGQMGATEPTRRPVGRPKRSRTAKTVSPSVAPSSPPNPRSPEPEPTPSSAPSV